jgi:hypothetical protein
LELTVIARDVPAVLVRVHADISGIDPVAEVAKERLDPVQQEAELRVGLEIGVAGIGGAILLESIMDLAGGSVRGSSIQLLEGGLGEPAAHLVCLGDRLVRGVEHVGSGLA